jgi:hypothetical protein
MSVRPSGDSLIGRSDDGRPGFRYAATEAIAVRTMAGLVCDTQKAA